MPGRRLVLVVIAGVIMSATSGFCQTPPPDELPGATAAEAGFAPDLGERLDAGVRDGRFENLHAVLVLRGGRLVLERYYAGEDERWGRARGRVAFGPDDLHDLRSITKSVVGLLYGIALAEGEVPPLDASLLDQFPEYPDLAGDPMRRRMTVAHALSMTLGTEWDEGLSYADPRNSEHAMELAKDRYRFVLDRPMVAEPGTRWVYNGGATALLGRLIAKGSGRSLRAYAREKLFAPLGIAEYEWVQGQDGEFIAASGLRLRPRDLAKIGQLVLDGGRWEGRQIVPADWLERSFRTQAKIDDTLDYGYQWWLGPQPADGQRWVAGFGNGGQRLSVMRRLDLVMVVMAGNYNQPDAWKLPVAIMTEIVIPAVRRD
jgi:CubicO group peptidase (beta-lactamase class C family)